MGIRYAVISFAISSFELVFGVWWSFFYFIFCSRTRYIGSYYSFYHGIDIGYSNTQSSINNFLQTIHITATNACTKRWHLNLHCGKAVFEYFFRLSGSARLVDENDFFKNFDKKKKVMLATCCQQKTNWFGHCYSRFYYQDPFINTLTSIPDSPLHTATLITTKCHYMTQITDLAHPEQTIKPMLILFKSL